MQMHPSKQGTGFRHYLPIILALSTLLCTLVIIEPLGPDNTVLHSIASDLVYYGRIPYIGTWDNNFPGIMLMHAASIELFGPSAIGFRLFDVMIQLAFVTFLYRILLRWVPAESAALASLLYICYYVAGSVYLLGQQDGYGMMAVLVGTGILLTKDHTSLQRSFGAGCVIGLSLLMRPTFLLYPAILALYLLVDDRLRPRVHQIPVSALLLVSSLIPLTLLLTYYATIPGGIEAFYTSTIRFNLDLYTNLPGGSLWREVLRTGLFIPFAIYAAASSKRLCNPTPSRKLLYLYIMMIGAGLFVVLLMAKYWRYQFAPFFMALVPATAIGIELAASWARSTLLRHNIKTAALLLCTLICYNPLAPLAFGYGLWQKKDPFSEARAARRLDRRSEFNAEQSTLSYLNQPEHANLTVEVCAFLPTLRVALGRRPVGQFVGYHAIGFHSQDNSSLRFTTYQRVWQRAYMDTLSKLRPDYVVFDRNQKFFYMQDIRHDCLDNVPGFNAWLDSNYRADTAFGSYELFRRRS